MKVWVVIDDFGYEGEVFQGVFESKEAADMWSRENWVIPHVRRIEEVEVIK